MKKFRTWIIISMLTCLGMLMFLPVNAFAASAPKAASASHTLTAPVSGTISNGKTFTGTLTVTRFEKQGQKLLAVGTISGVVKNASGIQVEQVTNQQITVPALLPVISAVGTCSILALTIGTLDLNILGLVVHLNQVVLNITAVAGAGSLLGNLLCSVAGLLNGGTPLSGLVSLLNQILAAL